MERTNDYITEDLMKGVYYDAALFQDVYVPERYANRIVAHVVAPYLSANHYFLPPLYLAIHGAPGEGKTAQALAACTRRGILVRYLSASQLSGGYEGDSRAVIETAYNQCEKLQKMGKYICLLLDDFHLGNASTENRVSRTVNSELLVGYMMNLAETSNRSRVPVLLTGNDFSGVYEALLRDGRADIYEWSPTDGEKKEIAQHILRQIVVERDWERLDRFICHAIKEERNIAFFTQLRADLRREILTDALKNCTHIDPMSLQQIDHHIQKSLHQIDAEHLEQLAAQRKNERKNGGLEHGAARN